MKYTGNPGKIKVKLIDEKQKEIVERYQCPGCVCGGDISCFEAQESKNDLSCAKHVVGTMATGTGKFFLGMPKGFNRLGDSKVEINIFPNQEAQIKEWSYCIYNIPVWKYKNKDGHVFIRGLRPRTNMPFLHIIIDCPDFDKINCLEITDNDIEFMD